MIIITIILIIKVVMGGKTRKEQGRLGTITTELKTNCI